MTSCDQQNWDKFDLISNGIIKGVFRSQDLSAINYCRQLIGFEPIEPTLLNIQQMDIGPLIATGNYAPLTTTDINRSRIHRLLDQVPPDSDQYWALIEELAKEEREEAESTFTLGPDAMGCSQH